VLASTLARGVKRVLEDPPRAPLTPLDRPQRDTHVDGPRSRRSRRLPVGALRRWVCCARVCSREAPWTAGQISRDARSACASPCRRQESARAGGVGGTWLARAPGGRSASMTAAALRSAADARSPSAFSTSAKTPARPGSSSAWPASTRIACATSARRRARQSSAPTSEDWLAARLASPSTADGAALGEVAGVAVMMAMVGGRPRGHNGH
jgi:hypothetical protein